MKIEFKITKRDIKLLIVLAICIALFCYYRFGIQTLSRQIDELSQQEAALELEQMQMQLRIAAIPVYEKNVKEQEETLAGLSERFFELQSNEKLDRYLTSIFVEQEMTMQDSTLSTAALDDISPYSLSRRMSLYKSASDSSKTSSANSELTAAAGAKSTAAGEAKDTASSDVDISDSASEEEVGLSTEHVYSTSATYIAVGTKAQALAVLDRLAEESGLRVVSFSISDVTQQSGTSEESYYETKKRLEVNLIIYMCDK